jgi:hypothetical protein
MLIAIILAACTVTPENENLDEAIIATAVEAQMQTQAAEQAAHQETQDSSETQVPDYPAIEACTALSTLLNEQLSMDVETGPTTFSDPASGVTGAGCQLAVLGTGEEVSDWGTKTSNFVNAMTDAGWAIDPNFSAGGAGGELHIVRRDGVACSYLSEVRPEDPSLCSGNEALAACLGRLNPSYIVYGITIGCTPDSYVPPTETPEANDESAIRISFDPGAISSYMNGALVATDTQLFVLRAMEGQEMTVSLNTSPPVSGIVVIYGADGTVLISDHATTGFWSGMLPLTQDYHIRVVASPTYAIAYSLEVIIPPVGERYIDIFQPISSDMCADLADIISTGMGVEVHTTYALFEDYLSGSAGMGCNVTGWGTWDMFGDRNAVETAVMNGLAANGWGEAPEYTAGGAGGFATGYSLGNNLCIYSNTIREMDPWVCDDFDGPIYNCWDAQDATGMYMAIEMICATGN